MRFDFDFQLFHLSSVKWCWFVKKWLKLENLKGIMQPVKVTDSLVMMNLGQPNCQLPLKVRTEDVPLRALWKEFQECEALVAENVAAANATSAPVMPRVRQAKIAKSERLPCMVQLEEQEKNLVQLNQLLHQQLPQTPPGLIREADKSEMSEMPHITPPMLGTPSKSSPESQAGWGQSVFGVVVGWMIYHTINTPNTP